MFDEFMSKITGLSANEVWADLHGGIAMLILILFGVAITLYFMLDKIRDAIKWLKVALVSLLAGVAALDLLGLSVYIPYRASGGDSPRSLLLSSPDTAWLHQIIFEHKEFVAFAPLILVAVAVAITFSRGDKLTARPYLKKALLFSVVVALVFVLVVSSEAVLVTKAAPLQ